MSMMSSAGSNPDTNSAFTLLDVIADPVKYKAALADYDAKAKAAGEAIAEANAAKAEAVAAHDRLDQAALDLLTAKEAFAADCAKRKDELAQATEAFRTAETARTAELDQRQAALAERSKNLEALADKLKSDRTAAFDEVAARSRALDAREAAITAQLGEIADRETLAKQATDNANALRDSVSGMHDDLVKKLDQVRAFGQAADQFAAAIQL